MFLIFKVFVEIGSANPSACAEQPPVSLLARSAVQKSRLRGKRQCKASDLVCWLLRVYTIQLRVGQPDLFPVT